MQRSRKVKIITILEINKCVIKTTNYTVIIFLNTFVTDEEHQMNVSVRKNHAMYLRLNIYSYILQYKLCLDVE